MRYYIIIGKPPLALKATIPIFEEKGDFKCLGIIENMTIQWNELFEFSPELVIINLDDPLLETFKILELFNKKAGIIPKYIGITASYARGFQGFQVGFVDVIVSPFTKENILTALERYQLIYNRKVVFCIESYHDFQYLNLKKVVLIKAERYISEFFLKDGSTKNNFKNLKTTHSQLPFNFQRISRSFVINSLYVYRIHTGKKQIYLRHYPQPLRYTEKYFDSIIYIKQQILKTLESDVT